MEQKSPVTSRRRSRGALLIKILIALVIVVLGMGYVPYSSSYLKTRAESLLKRYTTDSLSIEGVSVTPWRALSVRGIRISARDSSGMTRDVAVEKLTLGYHFLPAVTRLSELKRMLVSPPAGSSPVGDSSRAGPRAGKALGALTRILSSPALADLVKRFSLSGVDVQVTDKGREIFIGAGIRFTLEHSEDAVDKSLYGSILADSLCYDESWSMSDLKAELRVEEPNVHVERLRAELMGGDVHADVSFDLARTRLIRGEVKLNKVNVAQVYRSFKGSKGSLTGRLSGSLTLSDCLPIPDSLVGKGSVKVRDVVAQDLPLQSGLAMVLMVSGLSRLEFGEVSTSYEIRRGTVNTPDIRGTGNPLSFESAGWVGLNGYFSQDFKGVLSDAYADKLPPIVKNTLIPQDEGGRAFMCVAKGTFDNPKFTLHQEIVQRAVKNAFEVLGESLIQMLRKR